MKRIILLMAAMLLCTLSICRAQTPEVQIVELKSLHIEGLQSLSRADIQTITGLVEGESISVPADLTEAIQRLWKQDLFEDIRFRQDDVTADQLSLTLELKERDRINSVQFAGITKSQEELLRAKIHLVSGTVWTEAKRKSAQRVVRNFLVEKGFYQTEIDIQTKPSTVLRHRVDVVIYIKKGPFTRIQQIDFEGNKVFSDAFLLRKLKGVKEQKALRLWARSKYVPHQLRAAQALVLAEYRNAGYRDASVKLDTVYLQDEQSVRIRLQIFEGNVYHYRKIEWAGNNRYDQELLQQQLGIKPGDVYNHALLMQRLTADPQGTDIQSHYMDQGFLFFQVNPVEVRVEHDSIDLQIGIVEGPQTTIRNIIVEGNTRTSDEVILRMLRTYPGKTFSRADIIRSQRELLSLGHFNEETLNVIPVPDMETGTVDLKYMVEEKSSDQVSLQLGWNPNSGDQINGGLVGTVQLNLNNFSTRRLFKSRKEWGHIYPAGDDQKLSLAIQLNGLAYQKVAFSFLEPWLGRKKPHSLGISTSYTLFADQNTNYKNRIFTTSIDHGRRLTWPDDYVRSYSSLTYKYYDVTDPSSAFSNSFLKSDGTPEEQAFVNQLSFSQRFERNSLDGVLFPRSGSLISLGVEATVPWSLFGKKDYSQLEPAEKFNLLEYHKWTLNSSWYLRLVGDLVLHAKVQAGYLGFYNKDIGTSPFERFYVGGTGIATGFTLDGRDFIPLRGYDDGSLDNNGEGYSIYNRFALELRMPITLSGPVPSWVVGFVEAGNGYDGIRDYNPFRLKRSAGLGVRLQLPAVGLIGVDYGYGFDQDDGNGRGQFHLILGREF